MDSHEQLKKLWKYVRTSPKKAALVLASGVLLTCGATGLAYKLSKEKKENKIENKALNVNQTEQEPTFLAFVDGHEAEKNYLGERLNNLIANGDLKLASIHGLGQDMKTEAINFEKNKEYSGQAQILNRYNHLVGYVELGYTALTSVNSNSVSRSVQPFVNQMVIFDDQNKELISLAKHHTNKWTETELKEHYLYSVKKEDNSESSIRASCGWEGSELGQTIQQFKNQQDIQQKIIKAKFQEQAKSK